MQRLNSLMLPALAALALAGMVAWAVAPLAGSGSARPATSGSAPRFAAEIEPAVAKVDGWFVEHWQSLGQSPAAAANELQVFRRLTLALWGTIPSLQEVRAFEADAQPDRLRWWTLRLLDDRRFGDYFAERLAV